MVFFSFVGGIVLFGALWLFVPRVSFLAIIGLYLHYQYGFFSQTERVLTWGIFFEGLTFVLLVFGIFIGLILDVIILTEGGKK